MTGNKPLNHNGWNVLSLDVAAILLSYWTAFQLRFDLSLPPGQPQTLFHTIPIVLLGRLILFHYFGLYRGIWRYASMADLTSIFKAIILSQLLISAVVLFLQHPAFPRTVLIIDPLLTLVFVGGIRFLIRATREWRHSGNANGLQRMLIFGAGDLGESVLRELQRDTDHGYHVVGFLDDNPDKWHLSIHGRPIFGGRNLLTKIIDKYSVDEVVIAGNHSKGRLISDLMEIYNKNSAGRKVQFKTVPTLSDSLKKSPHSRTQFRKIELSNLLNRKPVKVNLDAVSGILSGKTVLVTGAGGTIGAELCRQILRFKPGKLLMLENHNTALFYLDKEIAEIAGGCEVHSLAGDICDKTLLGNIFTRFTPQVVFHAAAHKHVPLMETNPQEAVKNNTLGTYLLAETAIAHQTERFLFISTDKAVKPSSVMGASKRLGEMAINAMNTASGTKFMSVRFGNVLGSSGSAVNIFKEQIAGGGPVTVTHPDVTRYFMTPEEAIQLILQACSMGAGGEIFVLNMGQPVKVAELAKNLILLAGLEPGKDIKIVHTGLRPGEKLHEELFRENDVKKETSHPDISMATSTETDAPLLQSQMQELQKLCATADAAPLLKYIKTLIPAYNSSHCAIKSISAGHAGNS